MIQAGYFHEGIGGGSFGDLNPIGGSAVHWRMNLKIIPVKGVIFLGLVNLYFIKIGKNLQKTNFIHRIALDTMLLRIH